MSTREEFVTRFGGVFEHSPFIAERAYDDGFIHGELTADRVHTPMVAVFRAASEDERLGVLRAHPDLAGRLAISGELTEDSRQEQAGAGLDRLFVTTAAQPPVDADDPHAGTLWEVPKALLRGHKGLPTNAFAG